MLTFVVTKESQSSLKQLFISYSINYPKLLNVCKRLTIQNIDVCTH